MTPDDLAPLAASLAREVALLAAALPAATDAQWVASPIPKPRFDTSQRAQDDRHADPTSDVALDTRRLALRQQIVDSEAMLREALITVVGVRRGIEIRLARWAGGHSE